MTNISAQKSIEKPTQAVLLENLNSVECFQTPSGIRPVLHDISFEIACGDVCCVTGPSHFELRLLLELLSNARPYASGRCVLCERGMMRKKRVILPHIHYIGGTNMLFNNMNVLEYMMFITSRKKGNAAARQKLLLQALEKSGLGFICLSPISMLTPEERSVVCLFASTLTGSELVIWNISRLVYSPELVEAAARIARALRQQSRALVFSTTDYALAQALSTQLIVIKDGGVAYCGKAQAFAQEYDRLLFTLSAPEAERYEEAFKKAAPYCECEKENDILRVYDPSGEHGDISVFFKAIAEENLCPTKISRNSPNIGNAIKKAQVSL